MLRILPVISLSAILSATGAAAHEFWIDPQRFQIPAGSELRADLRVGEEFKGGALPYVPHQTRRFEAVVNDRPVMLQARAGDRPALSLPVEDAGLAVVVHVTSDSVLSYREFEKFAAFVAHKDADWVLDAHRDRGLPETGFREVFSRHAKALVAVGDGAGEDRAFGLETEIVALDNPYAPDLGETVEVRLLYRGAPRSDAQIEVFERAADDSVSVSLVRTDAEGRAAVPVRRGNRYMLDAVVLREPAPELAAARDAVWESLWANLTFAIPD